MCEEAWVRQACSSVSVRTGLPLSAEFTAESTHGSQCPEPLAQAPASSIPPLSPSAAAGSGFAVVPGATGRA